MFLEDFGDIYIYIEERCRHSSCTESGIFWGGGGNGRGGGIPHRRERYNVCPQWRRAVTSGLSCDCDITFVVTGRPKSVQQLRESTVAARRVERRRTVIPGDTNIRVLTRPPRKMPYI